MKREEFNHRLLISECELIDMQIRENGKKFSEICGSIYDAKKELMRIMKIDYTKSFETAEDIKELIAEVGKAKANIRSDLSYTNHRGDHYNVYYTVDIMLIRDYLDSVECCELLKDKIINNITINGADIVVDKDEIIRYYIDNIDDEFLDEELLNYYIEQIQDASDYHRLTYSQEDERQGEYLSDLLFRYLK